MQSAREFSCPLCDKIFDSLERLRMHLIHEAAPFTNSSAAKSVMLACGSCYEVVAKVKSRRDEFTLDVHALIGRSRAVVVGNQQQNDMSVEIF